MRALFNGNPNKRVPRKTERRHSGEDRRVKSAFRMAKDNNLSCSRKERLRERGAELSRREAKLRRQPRIEEEHFVPLQYLSE